MDNCKIVADLLPTYCDALTSEETNTFIRSHLNSCENCSRLLDRMQQKRERHSQADARRMEFKAALMQYERKHKMRMRLLMAAVALLIGVFFVFRGCSFDLAIAAAGLNGRDLTVVQQPIADSEGKVFQVVFSRTEEDGVLAYLEKNELGFWIVKDMTAPDQDCGVAQMVWAEYLFSNHFGEPDITIVFHTIYAGCNAVDSLEKLLQEDLPKNVTVLVTQNSRNYYVHVITVLPDGGSPFDLLPLLKENNLIAQTKK